MSAAATYTLLEETRQCHEDIERLERLMVREFRKNAVTYREKMEQNYTVSKMMGMIQEKSAKLVRVYEDAHGEREEDIARLRGDRVFENYYRRVEGLKDFYSGGGKGEVMIQGYEEECDQALRPVVEVDKEFSGEEGLGRYMDVMEFYHQWKELHQDEDGSYMDYVKGLDGGHVEAKDALSKVKEVGKYTKYLEDLSGYLASLYERTHPLSDWKEVKATMLGDFEATWEEELKASWCREVFGDENGVFDLEKYSSVEELEEALGAERLKAVLVSMGLKCGGTARQRAERLMSVKGLSRAEIDPSLFAKGAKKMVKKSDGDVSLDVLKTIAWLEYHVKYMCTKLLEKQWKATLDKLEKRQAQTYDEFVADMEAELEEDRAEDVFADEDEQEDEYLYNPLKLPLGWDGKPIPYWMYKMHGLNHEYSCEICGNATYRGRRAFEKHFTEPRHSAGMKALGIPNTRQFFEITSITEAVNLWNSLQSRKSKLQADNDEEFEDEEGNVYNRKMYENLQRQGI